MRTPQLQKTALAVTRWVGSPASIVIHTLLFALSFASVAFGWVSLDRMLLVLTTIVSLEAIYLAIFIQMTLNFTTEAVAVISEDVEEMQEDVGEIQEDIDEIQEDVDELQEDVEDISEEDAEEEAREVAEARTLATIQSDLRKLVLDIEKLQNVHPPQPPTAQ